MKKILIACGSGIVTSTHVRNKIEKVLNDNGFAGQYSITQCRVSETPGKSPNFDFVIATSKVPDNVVCPYVPGVCFLTGVNTQPSVDQIIELMKK